MNGINMIEMAETYQKTRSIEKYLSSWKTDDQNLVPLMRKYINHQNPKIRLVIAEIGEKYTSILLKNLSFDNFEPDKLGNFFIDFILNE